jgi:hypothetical protein
MISRRSLLNAPATYALTPEVTCAQSVRDDLLHAELDDD